MNSVGADDNFFELGGHSLLMVRLQTRLDSTLGKTVSIVNLFQYPAISSLAESRQMDSRAGRSGSSRCASGR